jgi:hypothetical protein
MRLPSRHIRKSGFAGPTAALRTGLPQALDHRIESLRIGEIWRALWKQSPAVWFILVYVFFEYVRPQSVWPTLDVLPFGQIFLLGSTILVFVENRLSFRSARTLWVFVGIFTTIIIFSGIFAQYPGWSWDLKDVWINWLLLMLIVGAGIRTRAELLLLLVSFVLWNLKMSQFGARAWVANGFSTFASGVSGGPGWFQNSGEFGIEMCLFLPLAAYFTYGLWPRLGKWQRILASSVIFTVLISIVVGSSRGAFVGMMVVAVWAIALSPYRTRAALIAIPLAAFTWIVLPQRTKDRLAQSGEDKDSVARLTYWKDGIEIANRHPVLGIGYNNWIPYYHSRYNPEGELPHNYFIECVTQTGYVGLTVFCGMLVVYFRQNGRTRRLTRPDGPRPDRLLWSLAYGLDGAMVGFMASGFFVSVLWYPYIWMNIALSMAVSRVAHHRLGVQTSRPRTGLAGPRSADAIVTVV